MAADEVLLRRADQTGQGALRFYQWSEPTLSLGYFQSHIDRQHHKPSKNCPMVRRSSGGGAIVHDYELTYSVAIPLHNRWSKDAARLYSTVHNSLLECLGQLNITCQTYAGETDDREFLCFLRRAAGDVVLRGTKVMGSAQRRTKSGMIQHGSLLLRQSSAAPELPGLTELTGQHLDPEEIVKYWRKAIKDRFSVRFCREMFVADEIDQIKSLANEKYRQDTWNLRR